MKRIYIKPDIETTQISIEKHLAAGSPSNPGYDYGEDGSGGSGTVDPYPNKKPQETGSKENDVWSSWED